MNFDIAQISLYLFWVFFACLIIYLRREDRREGYPLESDNPKRVRPENATAIPRQKKFVLPHGAGIYQAPSFERYTGPIAAERTAAFAGAPLEPTGDPMVDGVGPASFASRADEPELTRAGDPAIVPLRVATDFFVARQDVDPRGFEVIAADDKVAGVVQDIWIDRADPQIRYLEVEVLTPEGHEAHRALVPMPMVRVGDKKIRVGSIRKEHFRKVPRLANPDTITMYEEDRISAFYAGGLMYADPRRAEPLL